MAGQQGIEPQYPVLETGALPTKLLTQEWEPEEVS